MSFYKDQQAAAYTNWEQATDNGDTEKAIAKHMTEYLNYCQFVEQPELQARIR
jgi:hypothetical protein